MYPQNKNRKVKTLLEGFFLVAGSVIKNLPANAGDMGLTPGSGRSHMP